MCAKQGNTQSCLFGSKPKFGPLAIKAQTTKQARLVMFYTRPTSTYCIYIPDVVLNENIDNGVGKVLPAHQQECDNDVVESLVVVQVGVL